MPGNHSRHTILFTNGGSHHTLIHIHLHFPNSQKKLLIISNKKSLAHTSTPPDIHRECLHKCQWGLPPKIDYSTKSPILGTLSLPQNRATGAINPLCHAWIAGSHEVCQATVSFPTSIPATRRARAWSTDLKRCGRAASYLPSTEPISVPVFPTQECQCLHPSSVPILEQHDS